MMNIDEIDNDIVRQLENNGLKKGDREQRIKLLLTHAYMAIRMYWAMSPEDRVLTSEWHKKFRRSFSLKKFLKEGKRHGERKIPPCTPFIKKDPLEKGHKTSLSTACANSSEIEERQKAFWAECEQYIGKYERRMVLKFYYYWAEEMKGVDQMRWEIQKSWNTSYRLAAWSKRSFEANDQAAELRLAKAKGKRQAAEQQTMTAERDDNNARLEQEIAERKASAVSYEEWLKMKK